MIREISIMLLLFIVTEEVYLLEILSSKLLEILDILELKVPEQFFCVHPGFPFTMLLDDWLL